MGSGPNANGASRKHIHDQIKGSLQRLQMEYIDLYQIHWPNHNVPIEDSLEALI